MKQKLLFAGLDVHAKNITIALAESARKDFVPAAGGDGETRLYRTIANDLHALEKVFTKLRKAHPGAELRVGVAALRVRSFNRGTMQRMSWDRM